MKRHGRNISAPTVVLLTVLVIVAVIALFNYFATRNVQSSHIVLPSITDPSGAIAGLSEDYIVVSPENFSEVIASLSRPVAYHQSISASFADGEKQSVRSVELWVHDDVYLISESLSESVRHILTNGQIVYVWYDDNLVNIKETTLLPNMTMDDLAGVPTYEALLQVLPSDVIDAGYEQLSVPADNPCVYAQIQRGDAGTEIAWVDTATGLLCRAEFERDGAVYGTVEQTALEIFDIADISIQSVFYLPDGSEPFAFSSAAEMPPA